MKHLEQIIDKQTNSSDVKIFSLQMFQRKKIDMIVLSDPYILKSLALG